MFLGIDLGTTNVKALVVDGHGLIVATGSASVERYCDAPGCVEQDIEQIWQAVVSAIVQATRTLDAQAIRALGISSQGGAVQLLDAEDRPLGRVISWLDERGRPWDQKLIGELGADFLAAHTGHGGSTMTLGQVLRVRHESPTLLDRPNRLAFVGDVIVGRLCGRRVHDPTSLSIALLYNPWLEKADPEILARLGLEEEQLPELAPATSVAGPLRYEVAQRLGLRTGIPVSPAIHDQYAAALGTGNVQAGQITFGSGTAWVLLATTDRLAVPVVPEAFVSSHPVPGRFGQMLPLGTGGWALDWILSLLGQAGASAAQVEAWLQEAPPGSAGLRCWPLLVPQANTARPFQAGGRLDRVTRNHRTCHYVRAVVEGLACELARYVRLLGAAGFRASGLSMCGSAAGNATTPQIVADVTQLPVTCIELPDVSAFGAAMIARTLVEPTSRLVDVALDWVPRSRMVLPGPDATVARQVLEDYLAPFSREGA